jgi:hypothetical protein
MYSKEMEELLVFTCAVESAGGTYVKQIQGPAVGVFQIEPASLTDLWCNFIIRNPYIVNLLTLNFGVHRMPSPESLITDLRIAAAICALYYKRKKANLTSISPDSLWDVYKPLYNTVKGKAEKEASLKAYAKFIKA